MRSKQKEPIATFAMPDETLKAKATLKIHMLRLFPYLQNNYRKLDAKDIDNTETFKELFGDAKTNLEKLKVIFAYQNIL